VTVTCIEAWLSGQARRQGLLETTPVAVISIKRRMAVACD
jgi:hypothetical protein